MLGLSPSQIRAYAAKGVLKPERGERGELRFGFEDLVILRTANELAEYLELSTEEIVRIANLRAAVDVEEALDIAYEHIGRPQRASVLLVPRAQQRSTS